MNPSSTNRSEGTKEVLTSRKDYIDSILSKKAINSSIKKQKFSKRIILSAQSEYCSVVCEFTGSVSALHIPAIPGKVLSYVSPLAILSNARGIAGEGADYLYKLEVQTLAAILITLADEYELFRYQPTDTGAQKNAILRTIPKATLINCILFIEFHIHSGNYDRIPSLSLILTQEVQERGLEARMNEWLKLLTQRLIETTTEEEKEEAKQAAEVTAILSSTQIKPATISRAKKAAVAKQKEFRAFKKDSKIVIANLYKSQVISAKLREFLASILTGDQLVNAAETMISLICTKLRDLNDPATINMANKITHFYVELTDIEDREDEFESLAPGFSSSAPGHYIDEAKVEEENEFDSPSVPSTPTNSVAVATKPAKLTIQEVLAAKRAAKAAANNEAQENNDDF